MKDIFELIKNNIKLHEYASKIMKLKLVGDKYLGLCPFHHEKTPSFYINPAENLFYCFGCNKGGDIFTFYCDLNNCDKKHALKDLSSIAGIKYNSVSSRNDLNCLLDYFTKQEKHIQWLVNRGVSINSIKKFQLGWFGSFFEIIRVIKDKNLNLNEFGFKENLLKSLQNRVIFPIFNEIGSLISFSGRTIEKNDSFKYINGAESNIFHKNETLYGLNFIKNKKEIYLVEGYIDVIMMDQFEYSSVAAMGTAINENHLKKIWNYTNKIIVMLDGDDAGVKASERLAILGLNVISSGKELWFIQLPKKHDPDSYLRELRSLEGLKQYPLYEYLILNKEIPKNPDKRAVFFNQLNDLSIKITDKNLMFEYRKYWNSIRYSNNKNRHYEKIERLTGDYLILLLFKYVLCYNKILDHVAEDFLKIKMDNIYSENLVKILNHQALDHVFLAKLDSIYIEQDMFEDEVLSNWYDIYDKIQNCSQNNPVLYSLTEDAWEQYKKLLNKKEREDE